jgi:hypothetical protein
MSNDKMNVGQATAGDIVKRRWHKEGRQGSLKAFARKLVSEGDQVAKDWFDCKKGALNAERSDKNRSRMDQERSATKMSRKSGKK